jgi:GntR family transcriptional repressor for pyruvate dehydrogenase complex
MFKSLTIDTAPKQIAAQIKEAITQGRLTHDQRLPSEEELATKFLVSRPTVREALKRLAAENLIESRRGAAGGNFVKVPTQSEISTAIEISLQVAAALGSFSFEEILEMRLNMGTLCCRLAAKNCSVEILKALRDEINIQQELVTNDIEFCSSDVRFHGLLAQASGNKLMAACFSGVVQGLQPATNFMLFHYRDRKVISQQHTEVVDCIEAGDGEGAAEVFRSQVEYLRTTHMSAKQLRKQRSARQK